MKKISCVCLMTTLILGCTSNLPPKPLAEQLKGETPIERKETLRLACLNGAEKITGRTSMWKKMPHGNVPIYDEKVFEMKKVCRQMTAAYLTQDKAQHTRLRQACNAQLEVLENNKNTAPAIENMHKICHLMTAQGQ